jgi:hypothetical protein
MRSYDATNANDVAEAKRLHATPWMLQTLTLNPHYVSWGPHEDCMMKEGDDWESRRIIPTWREYDSRLDDLNEVVHFYFSIDRSGIKCENCGGDGYHPHAHWTSDSFYRHSSPFVCEEVEDRAAHDLVRSFSFEAPDQKPLRQAKFPSPAVLKRYGRPFLDFCREMSDGDGFWNDKITQDEVNALVKEKRLQAGVTADEVNAAQEHSWGDSMKHDAISRQILIRRRCERLGVPVTCLACEGSGRISVARDKTRLVLTLWVLHPRKGASRGVEISSIRKSELPAIIKFLKKAAERNAERFAKVNLA